MIYVNSETILNSDRFFSPYIGKVIHTIGQNLLTITYCSILITRNHALSGLFSANGYLIHWSTALFLAGLLFPGHYIPRLS